MEREVVRNLRSQDRGDAIENNTYLLFCCFLLGENYQEFRSNFLKKLYKIPKNEEEFKQIIKGAIGYLKDYLNAKRVDIQFLKKQGINTSPCQEKCLQRECLQGKKLKTEFVSNQSGELKIKINFAYSNTRNDFFDLVILLTFAVDQSKNDIQKCLESLQSFLESTLIAFLANVNLVQNLQGTASKDALTGLANRKKYEEFITNLRLPETKRETDQNVSLLMIDLDRFKKINDNYGHSTGDEVLKKIAQVLQKNLRQTDLAVRYGGDEFVVVLPNTNIIQAKNIAEKLLQSITEIHLNCRNSETRQKERKRTVNASIGVATYRPGEEVSTFQERADEALYQAKKEGRKRVVVFGESCEGSFECIIAEQRKKVVQWLIKCLERFA